MSVHTDLEAARLVMRTLEPRVVELADQARALGCSEDVQVDKAHLMGRAQGYSDALDDLLAVFRCSAPVAEAA